MAGLAGLMTAAFASACAGGATPIPTQNATPTPNLPATIQEMQRKLDSLEQLLPQSDPTPPTECPLSCPTVAPKDYNTITLNSIVYQGGCLSLKEPTITVSPSETFQLTINLTVLNNLQSGIIFPVALTPTWGDHQASSQEIGYAPSGLGFFSYKMTSIAPNIAPNAQGTFYVFIVGSPETTPGHVTSATRFYDGTPVWQNIDDVANWGETQYLQAKAQDRVIAPSLPEPNHTFAAAAIKVVVSSPDP